MKNPTENVPVVGSLDGDEAAAFVTRMERVLEQTTACRFTRGDSVFVVVRRPDDEWDEPPFMVFQDEKHTTDAHSVVEIVNSLSDEFARAGLDWQTSGSIRIETDPVIALRDIDSAFFRRARSNSVRGPSSS